MSKKQLIRKYFDEIVVPTVNEFLQSYYSQCDIRKATLAALVLNHMTDCMAEFNNIKNTKKSKDFDIFKSTIEAACPEMIVLRNISNIMKHRYLINSDQIVQEDKPGLFDAPWGEGYFAEASYVFYQDDKQCVAVPNAVKEALSYWDSKISALP